MRMFRKIILEKENISVLNNGVDFAGIAALVAARRES